MQILTGDECGQLKFTNIAVNKTSAKDAQPQTSHTHAHRVMDKTKSVVALHADSTAPVDRFWLSRLSGEVQGLSLTEKDYNLSFQCSSTPIGLGMNDNIIFTCTKSGQVELRSIDHDNQQVNQSHQSTSIGNGIQVCRLSPNKTNLFAAGGSDRPLSIYDLSALTNENPVPIYKAKGLGNDHLDLPRPTNITDLAFLPDSPAHVLTADKFGWIRLYDTRDPAARKHSVAHAITEATNFVTTTKNKQKFTCPTHVGYPIRRLIAPTDRMAVLSDTMGNLYQVDFRSGKTVGAFKGIAGAITDVQCDGTHVAAVGLDRHLRVYSWKNRSLVKKIYLKQRMTSVLLINDQLDKRDGDASGSDEEDVWKQMEVEVGFAKSKQR